ncbi:hypothetical protein RHS01_00255 [Rhizoctonia solani]|uniref:Uncharacterized protein n=1 Tax=Rhizoctonia solani TaxID=456999 RepID=A0A8H7ILT1_9AGAM|nr:hypothetical protein RHS01_00255 [Rhizoctonia solani]
MADLGNRTRDDSGLDSPPPVWTPEQEALLRRIMGGPPGAGSPDTGMADPLAAMMSMFSGPGGPLGDMLGGLGGKEGDAIPPALKNLGMGSNPQEAFHDASHAPTRFPIPRPETLPQPSAFASAQGDEQPHPRVPYGRDGRCLLDENLIPLVCIQCVITLQLILHSLSIFYDPTPTEPAGVLGMVIPHLPQPSLR